jgi:hypothetical protein
VFAARYVLPTEWICVFCGDVSTQRVFVTYTHNTEIHSVGRTYRAVNTLRLGYKNHSINAAQ